jgi:hypothetical protein
VSCFLAEGLANAIDLYDLACDKHVRMGDIKSTYQFAPIETSKILSLPCLGYNGHPARTEELR